MNRKTTFADWLRSYKGVTLKQEMIISTINNIIDSLQELLALPSLTAGDRKTLVATIDRWTAVKDLAVHAQASAENEGA